MAASHAAAASPSSGGLRQVPRVAHNPAGRHRREAAEARMQDLDGKVAFITGGASGVGLGQAKVFAEAGCRIVIADVRQDHIDEALACFRGRQAAVHAIRVDITDRDAYRAAADEAERIFGPVQLLFNTCGVSQFGPIQDATWEDWDWQLGVNLGGVVNGVMIFVPRMLARGQGGHVVTTASMAAFRGAPGGGIYCTSKFAVRGLTESLRHDLEPHGIGVSLLCPAGVNTNIHEAVLTRPARYARTGYYGPDPERLRELKSVIVGGMDPVVLAGHVLRAVQENRFWVLPYPEVREQLLRGHQSIIDALARAEDDPDCEDRKRRQDAAFAAVRARHAAAARK
jgi:NAD(P)-dependent dehydrogenase (short-subunit alcohol dehydrogenase family)